MENKNVFEETVEILIKDAKKLQAKFSKCQENNDFRSALDTMRLLKDILSLIKEYDWELKYSEYETDGHKEVSIWEQNHSGDIKNIKRYKVSESKNVWIDKFESCISSNNSYICTYADECRNSGKSYALSMLCDKHNGIVVSENSHSICGVTNNCNRFGFDVQVYKFKDTFMRQFKHKIVFIDEKSGLSEDQINKLKETHLVIGFK